MKIDSDTQKIVEEAISQAPALLKYLNDQLDTLHNPVSKPISAKKLLQLLIFAEQMEHV